MKNILFDIISIQGCINGGAEFTFRVLEELIKNESIQLIGLYDSSLAFVERGLDFYNQNLQKLVDIQKTQNINNIVEKEHIEHFFIGIAQRYFNYEINQISCTTTLVIHDIGDIESYDNKISRLWKKEKKRFQLKIGYPKKDKSPIDNYHNLLLFCQKPNVNIVTVSEYSKSSILYYFPELLPKKIEVRYPPMRQLILKKEIENEDLKSLVLAKSKYFLLLNIHRNDKNALFVLTVFRRYLVEKKQVYLVTTGGGEKLFPEHINLPLLSPSDLGYAYQYAYALIFPSLQEGFGYPPLEAMSYGTPVIAANVCSMPAILASSALFFSPFYKNDLFMKMQQLEKEYFYYKEQASKQFQIVVRRQQIDFMHLIKMIVNPH